MHCVMHDVQPHIMTRNTQDDTPLSEQALRRARLGSIFYSFFKIGLFTFGGGWVMISIIEEEVVSHHKWIPRDEFLDQLAIAQSLPGILAVNMAIAMGSKLRRFRGATAAAAGAVLPSFLIILAIAIFLTPDTIKHNHVISAIFAGIRPAVVALIIAPVITSARAARIGWRTIWIPIVVALMISLDMGAVSSPILYIVLGALGGYFCFVWGRRRHRKEGEQ